MQSERAKSDFAKASMTPLLVDVDNQASDPNYVIIAFAFRTCVFVMRFYLQAHCRGVYIEQELVRRLCAGCVRSIISTSSDTHDKANRQISIASDEVFSYFQVPKCPCHP
jgi:hypothetical protein